ncbi:hypothetical protein [uncultured Tateyamaria sp.]|uniref:hypothetical protein n=1 Tax=Tateyamaria sp. 1078 TaxID=3417464 RepID=UPI0026393531|nr:hypothetical protein [uncultured Tateyamaria sp.]
MPKANKTFTAEECRKKLDKLRGMHQHIDNVTGFDVGYRWVGGQRTEELCLRVHVTAKLPLETISDAQKIAKDVDGVPIDVITGPYRARRELGFGQQRSDQALLSGSACHRPQTGSGTIGAIAIDNETGATGILSNWHVLSTYAGQAGDPIYGEGSDRVPIATLQKSMLSRHGDAAFATLTGHRPWYPALRQLNISLAGVRSSTLGHVLCKYGRGSGLTRARVDGEGTYRVLHRVGPGTYEAFEIQGFRLVPEDDADPETEISTLGDSGACWVSPGSGTVVGLHMAGEGESLPEGEYALACDMPTVLDQLDLRLATLDDLLERGAMPPGAFPEAARGGAFGASGWLSYQPQGLTPHPWCPDPPQWPPAPGWPPVPPVPGGPFPPWPPFATPETGPVQSVSGNIWAEFKRTMFRLYPHLRVAGIEIDDKMSLFFQQGNAPALALQIIANSAVFQRDDVIPAYGDLADELIFRGVCIEIGKRYRANGFVVIA